MVLAYLHHLGLTDERAARRQRSAVDGLLDRYRSFLVDDLGLTLKTAYGYGTVARRFLNDVCNGAPDRVGELTARDVSRFGIGHAERGLGPATVTTMVVGVRSLLRWLYSTGQIPTRLAHAAPWLSRARMSSLPATIPPGVAQRILDTCDRATVVGAHDYALLMLFCRLGLRVSEVVAVELDDIVWRRGELIVRSKGGWRDPLPLPVDVGAALAGYVQVGAAKHRLVQDGCS